MEAILLEDASVATRTTQRRGDGTETPKHVVDTKQPEPSQFSGSGVEVYQVGILSFVSANQADSITLTGLQASLISLPQDQADAILEAPGADLAAHLRHVLPALPPVAPGEDFVPPEVVERLWSCDALIARQRIPSFPSTQLDLPVDEWMAQVRAWASSHPQSDRTIDDSRENIYGERGE